MQKKFKLKATGKWDKTTRNYFQKKYKYPTQAQKAIDRVSKKVKSSIKKVTGR